MPQHLYS